MCIAKVAYRSVEANDNQQSSAQCIFQCSFIINLSIDNGVPHRGMLLYLHHRDSKIFFHPAKFDNFKDEKISDFKTVSVSQRKNLLD